MTFDRKHGTINVENCFREGFIMIQEKCPYVEKCGACHMGQTTYEEELAAKKEL